MDLSLRQSHTMVTLQFVLTFSIIGLVGVFGEDLVLTARKSITDYDENRHENQTVTKMVTTTTKNGNKNKLPEPKSDMRGAEDNPPKQNKVAKEPIFNSTPIKDKLRLMLSSGRSLALNATKLRTLDKKTSNRQSIDLEFGFRNLPLAAEQGIEENNIPSMRSSLQNFKNSKKKIEKKKAKHLRRVDSSDALAPLMAEDAFKESKLTHSKSVRVYNKKEVGPEGISSVRPLSDINTTEVPIETTTKEMFTPTTDFLKVTKRKKSNFTATSTEIQAKISLTIKNELSNATTKVNENLTATTTTNNRMTKIMKVKSSLTSMTSTDAPMTTTTTTLTNAKTKQNLIATTTTDVPMTTSMTATLANTKAKQNLRATTTTDAPMTTSTTTTLTNAKTKQNLIATTTTDVPMTTSMTAILANTKAIQNLIATTTTDVPITTSTTAILENTKAEQNLRATTTTDAPMTITTTTTLTNAKAMQNPRGMTAKIPMIAAKMPTTTTTEILKQQATTTVTSLKTTTKMLKTTTDKIAKGKTHSTEKLPSSIETTAFMTMVEKSNTTTDFSKTVSNLSPNATTGNTNTRATPESVTTVTVKPHTAQHTKTEFSTQSPPLTDIVTVITPATEITSISMRPEVTPPKNFIGTINTTSDFTKNHIFSKPVVVTETNLMMTGTPTMLLSSTATTPAPPIATAVVPPGANSAIPTKIIINMPKVNNITMYNGIANKTILAGLSNSSLGSLTLDEITKLLKNPVEIIGSPEAQANRSLEEPIPMTLATLPSTSLGLNNLATENLIEVKPIETQKTLPSKTDLTSPPGLLYVIRPPQAIAVDKTGESYAVTGDPYSKKTSIIPFGPVIQTAIPKPDAVSLMNNAVSQLGLSRQQPGVDVTTTSRQLNKDNISRALKSIEPSLPFAPLLMADDYDEIEFYNDNNEVLQELQPLDDGASVVKVVPNTEIDHYNSFSQMQLTPERISQNILYLLMNISITNTMNEQNSRKILRELNHQRELLENLQRQYGIINGNLMRVNGDHAL